MRGEVLSVSSSLQEAPTRLHSHASFFSLMLVLFSSYPSLPTPPPLSSLPLLVVAVPGTVSSRPQQPVAHHRAAARPLAAAWPARWPRSARSCERR